MRTKLILLLVWFSAVLTCCKGRYSDIQVDSEDVQGYVSAYTQLDASNKDFLIYIRDCNDVDTNQIANYDEVMRVLNMAGFLDVEHFVAVHSKLKPVVDVISENPKVERFPGIGTADLSFLVEGEKQYRKFLEDSTLTDKDKDFYRAQMAQIETTKVDLFDKQEKNKHWVQLVREQAESRTDVKLDDIQIMQLTILEREISKL